MRGFAPTVSSAFVLAVLIGCSKEESHQEIIPAEASPAAQTAPTPPDATVLRIQEGIPADPPILALWVGPIYLAGTQPLLLFALWDDGTMIRRAETNASRSSDQLMIGNIGPAQARAVLGQVRQTGLFDADTLDGLLHMDGPEYLLALMDDAGQVLRRYHGREDWIKLNELNSTASPSAAEIRQFLDRWKATQAIFNRLESQAGAMRPYRGPVTTTYPAGA
jgi:hypothetical protein